MELGVLEHPEPVTTCCFSDNGFFVATGCTDSSIRIWNGNISLYTCVALLPSQSSSPRILFISFLSGNFSVDWFAYLQLIFLYYLSFVRI